MIDINWVDVGFFMMIIIVPLTIGRYFRLVLGREIVISVLRMSAQLLLVGLYLQFLFSLNSIWLNLIWLGAMVVIGASAILSGARLPRKGLLIPMIASLTLALLPVLLLLLLWLLQPNPFYGARYLIPLAGMLLGNSLSGNIIALQRLFSAFEDRRLEYEARLTLGATAQQAAAPFVQDALKQSLAPMLASMSTTGLVTLPGMMTGQILGGSDPLMAIKYQLIIMIAIFVMLSLSVTITLKLSLRYSLNDSGKLLFNRHI